MEKEKNLALVDLADFYILDEPLHGDLSKTGDL
jgi:hypothetical protein